MNIDHINLIIESTEFESKFIELFNLNETKDRSFIIPSLADDFKIELGFIFNKHGHFKINGKYLNYEYNLQNKIFKLTGYDINIFKNQNEILFSDLIQHKPTESNYRNYVPKNSGVEYSYEVEMVPKMPLIIEINLISTDSQLVFNIHKSDLTTNTILECKLGIWYI